MLPKPLDTRDRGGQVTVKNEDEHLELLPPEQPSALAPVEKCWNRSSRRGARTHLPEHIDVAWQPYKPKVSVSSVADLTLTPHEGRVRQTFRFHFPRSAPAQVALHFPEAIAGRWKIVRGGSVAAPADEQCGGGRSNSRLPERTKAICCCSNTLSRCRPTQTR